MTLYETLGNDLKEAMKAGETFKRDTLRLAQSALKNTALDKRKEVATLTDEEIVEVFKKLVKQRKDSITQYEAGGRADLATAEQKEIDILTQYLPAEMDDVALESTIRGALESASLTEKKDMGKAMGVAMGAVKGQASGDRVKTVVENILQ
jgi:uncharacterized protein